MSVASGWVCRRSVSAVFLAGLSYGCSAAPPQRVYVERLGADTTALEAFTRTDGGFEGQLVTRNPVTRVVRYRASLSPEGTVSRLEVEWQTPPANPEGPDPRRMVMELWNDSAMVIQLAPEGADTARLAVPPGTIPSIFPTPVAIWEQAVAQARSAGLERYEFNFLLQNGRLAPNHVESRAADTVSMSFFGNPLLAVVDEEGHIAAISGRETTMSVEIRRVDRTETVEVEALASEFAARDARGEGFGVASPSDTVRASLAGAAFELVYSRPAMRGREIWGGLVAWNSVWRTGANAATLFTTDRDLVIGETEVPAGSYTLWTTFTPEQATLIINKQTRIWGTAYDAAFDLAHVPLGSESLSDPVERFTMDIRPVESGGVLELSWDWTRYSVPLRAN